MTLFFFSSYGDHRDLHSFPTRRSSDLPRWLCACADRTRFRRRHRFRVDRTEEARRIELIWGSDREVAAQDRKSTRLNSSHEWISYAVFCLKKKKKKKKENEERVQI